MIVFCTSCWAENEATATRCSRCSADLTGGLDQKGYVDKLIHSLVSHPIHETRVRAAWILGNRREARAVPVLAEILASSGDGDFDLKKAVVTRWARSVTRASSQHCSKRPSPERWRFASRR